MTFPRRIESPVGSVTLLAAIVLALACPPAGIAAENPAASMFSFGGFGTLGVVHSDEDEADFTTSPTQAVGAGHTHAWSAAVDSRLAAQVTAQFNPRLSAVLQVISEQNYDDTYRPHVEWANIKLQLTEDFSVRVGRIAQPLFLENDSRKIGYANPWLRPPPELYSLVPATSNDGIDAIYRLPIGAATNIFQISVGRASYKIPIPNGGGSLTSNARDQVVLVDSLQRGFASVRLTYSQGHVTIPQLHPMFDAFRQFGPAGAAIADRYDDRHRIVRFFGLSASYEPGDWFAMGEWGRIITHSAFGDRTGWYLSGGYRLGRVTPYANYAQLNADSNTSDPGLDGSALPPAQAAAVTGLNRALNAALGAHAPQKTISIGARLDFLRNVDLKVQFDRIRLGEHSQGTLTNPQPGYAPGGSLNVLSATIDFVF